VISGVATGGEGLGVRTLFVANVIGSVAERLKIRRFTMIISAWWLRTSSKLSGKKSKK